MYTVYGLVNDLNGELFYIGLTKQRYACRRKGNHIEESRKGLKDNKKERYIRACNYQISLVILEKFEGDQKKGWEREQFFIDLHKPHGNTTGAKSIPPIMGGWNKKDLPKEILDKLGKEPDYILAKKAGVCKPCIARRRRALNIPSYAESTGNNGKIKLGDPHRRWNKN